MADCQSRFIELFGDLASPDCKWETKKLVETCVAADDIKCGPFGTQLSKDEYVDSGNKEIDSTLNYLLQKADKILDNTKISIVLPENLSVHTFSINVILGNLLDNAIEAAQNSKEKYLGIDIRTKRGLLFITIENSYDGSIQLHKNEIVTSRKNKESHGIGLKNVKMIVEEQGGEMQVIWVNNRFVVKVMLYLSALNE